jgi:hypothetical protein
MHQTLPALDRRLLFGLAAAKLALHLALANRYGYFRDELYFLDCGRHLDWGYVDHAPLIGLVSRLALLMGGSLPALRAIPAVAGAVLVALAVLIAHRLGGGRFAQALTGLAVLAAPIYLGIYSLLSMNAFEPLFWMGAVYLLIRVLQGGDERLWLAIGLVLGMGLMNKHSTAFFGVALAAGLLLSPERRLLRARWPWLGLGVALLVFLPNLAWQAAHGFPTLEVLRNVARIGKNVVLGPVEFVTQQVVLLHPALLPLWLGGLAYLFRGREGRYRSLGWTYVVFFGLLFALKAKNYYLAPIYPLLFAAGACGLEELLERATITRGRRWPRFAVLGLVLVAGSVLAPIALPLLPPARYVAYSRRLGIGVPRTEVGHRGRLPQLFGDQFGWPEMVREVARIYHALPPEERATATLFANNYGEAGAINFFGPALGLPRAVSAHQNYFFWGPRGSRGDVVIVLQDDREDLERLCASVEEAGRHDHPWGMAEENGPIFVCRGLRVPIDRLWPSLKKWN